MSKIKVRILLNGKDKEIFFPYQNEVTTVDLLENRVRKGFDVHGGFLSSSPDSVQVVFQLSAGSEYYFLEFKISQPAPQPDLPITPDFRKAIYCLVGVFYDVNHPNDLYHADLSVLGTCFAISKHHLVTALHIITDNNLVHMGIAQTVYKSGKIDPNDFHLVSQLFRATEAREDWTILQLSDLSYEMTFLPVFLDKMHLPDSTTHLVVHDYPVGAFVNVDGGVLVCDKIATSIYGYQSIGITSKSQKQTRTIKLATPSFYDLKNEQVVIKHGKSFGSCGGPYCLRDGTVLAIHVASQNDYDPIDSYSNPHISYGIGHVLCAFNEFINAFNNL